MCLFITIALPSGADLHRAKAILRRHGRTFKPVTPTVTAPFLRDGDAYGLTTRDSCDCDTAVGVRLRKPDENVLVEKRRKLETKLARKKRPDPKLLHRIRLAREVDARETEEVANANLQEAQRWVDLLRELVSEPDASGLRLLLMGYSGLIEREPLPEFLGDKLTTSMLSPEVILEIREGVVYEIRNELTDSLRSPRSRR